MQICSLEKESEIVKLVEFVNWLNQDTKLLKINILI